MLEMIPGAEEMKTLVGESRYDVWIKLSALIEEYYDMDCLWNQGGKAWKYEYQYRRGGKTLCALYARENCVGFMIILGRDERLRFEADRDNYSKEVQRIYDETQTYHDGKWLMFEPIDTTLFDDFLKLLRMKRKPNRKTIKNGGGPRYAWLKTTVTIIQWSSISAKISPLILCISWRQIYSPRPLPLEELALDPCQKLSKIWGSSSGISWQPLLVTEIRIQSSSGRTEISSSFPSPYFTAFSIMLCRTSALRPASPFSRQSLYFRITSSCRIRDSFSL